VAGARRNSLHGREVSLQTMPYLTTGRGGELRASEDIASMQTHIGYIRPEALQYRAVDLPNGNAAEGG